MDSVTQAALGATVGGVVAGRTLGRKAFVIGAIAGTAPDLDIVARFFVDETTRLLTHRSATHSLILMPMLAALLAWRLPGWASRTRLLRAAPLSSMQWFALLFWCFVTHILLDWCTIFGTQLWFPLTTEAYAFPVLFIIDPLYSAPLLIAVAWGLRRARTETGRRRVAVGGLAGLAVSGLYLAFAVFAKSLAVAEVNAVFAARGVEARQQVTHNSPLNTVLWRTVAVGDHGYWTADYSLAGCGVHVKYVAAHPQREAFVAAAREDGDLRNLLRFSGGFFYLRDLDGELVFTDLRYGEGDEHPFQFRVGVVEDGEFKPHDKVRRADFERLRRESFARLWRRLRRCDADDSDGF